MGLLSKLFGDDKAGKSAMDFIKDVVDDVKNDIENIHDAVTNDTGDYKNDSYSDDSDDSPSGFSWGEKMPDEENQYSFNGTYVEYFDQIYKSEFPDYDVTHEKAPYREATVFTFRKDGKTALVVELLSRTSNAYKIRKDCAAAGIPYLRYYYNYHGWWNTRSYVIQRTRNALK